MLGILEWECIVHGKELENVKQDRKHSKRIERYEVSENAIYFDGDGKICNDIAAEGMIGILRGIGAMDK
jgi:hypothetical protein